MSTRMVCGVQFDTVLSCSMHEPYDANLMTETNVQSLNDGVTASEQATRKQRFHSFMYKSEKLVCSQPLLFVRSFVHSFIVVIAFFSTAQRVHTSVESENLKYFYPTEFPLLANGTLVYADVMRTQNRRSVNRLQRAN